MSSTKQRVVRLFKMYAEAWYFLGNINIWKKKFGKLGAREVRRLSQLEDENVMLKKLVADLTLDKIILLDMIKKRFKTRLADLSLPYG